MNISTTFSLLLLLVIVVTATTSSSLFILAGPAGIPGKAFVPFLSPSGREQFGFACTDYDTEATSGVPLKLWVVGGSSSSGLEQDVWSFDTSRRVWEKQLSENFDKQQVAFTLHAIGQPDGSVELLAIGGKEYSTNRPISKVQGFSGTAWTEIDALAANGGLAKPSRAYWAGSWSSTNQFGPDGADIWFIDGISDSGFTREAARLSVNRTRGVASAGWEEPLINSNTGPRPPVYGSCCAKDPTRPAQRRAVCFGGENYLNSTNEIIYVNYASGSPFFQQKAALGTAPDPRSSSACGFVAQDKFVVYAGYNSNTGGPINDKVSYVLDVSVDPPVWSVQPNHFSAKPLYSGKIATCRYNNNSLRTYLFGGTIGDFQFNNELFEWKPGQGFQPVTAGVASTKGSHLVPTGRAFHNAVEFKSAIVIFNGQDEQDELLNDLWAYSTFDGSWSLLSFVLSDSWTARAMAGAQVVGGVIVFYGGFIDAGYIQTSRELVEVDILTGTVTKTSDVGNAGSPNGRAAFGCFVQNKVFVVASGKGDLYQTVPDWNGFNTITQTWSPLFLQGNKTLHASYDTVFRRFAPIAHAYNETHAIFGLGFGFDSKFDLFWIYNVSTETQSFEARAISTSRLLSGGKRDYLRGFASSLITGQYLFVCAGMVSNNFIVPPKHATCYSVDLVDEVWFSLGGETTSFQTVGSQVSYIGRTLYITGGYKSNQVAAVRNTQQDVTRFVFDKAAMCRLGGTTFGCIVCSKGSVNFGDGECHFSDPGKYVSDPSKGPVNCSAGSYQAGYASRTNTECTPCPFGKKAPNEGMGSCVDCDTTTEYCPVGTANALQTNSPRALILSNVPSATESHPNAFNGLPTPWLIISIVVSIIAFIFILLIFITFTGYWSKRRRQRHYLSEELEDSCNKLYEMYAKARLGMSEGDFMTCLVAERNALLPNHKIDPEVAHRIFRTVDYYHAGYFTPLQFQEGIIVAISTGYMSPFEGTPAVAQPKLKLSPAMALISRLELQDLDYFDDQHQLADNGESNFMVKNSLGGLFTLIMTVLLIGLTMSIVLDFLLNNVIETKSVVPRAVIYSIFSSEPNGLVISTPIAAHVTVFGLFRSSQGVASLRDGCIDSASAVPNQCSFATATPLGIETVRPGNVLLTRLECRYDDVQETCTISWYCDDCYIEEGSNGGNVTFTLSPAYASPLVRSRVDVGTGLRDPSESALGVVDIAGGSLQFSTSDSYVAPTDNKTIFSGYPASTFYYGLTNTYFEAQGHGSLFGDANAFLATGYHIRQSQDPTPGSQIPPEFFEKKFDVPVTLKFFVDATPVLVKRALIQTILDLISSLLGSCSGLMGLIIMALQFFEGFYENENYDEDADKLEDLLEAEEEGDNNAARGNHFNNESKYVTMTGKNDELNNDAEEMTNVTKKKTMNNIINSSNEDPISAADFSKIQKLLSTGMPLHQAQAVIKAIELALDPSSASPLPKSSSSCAQQQFARHGHGDDNMKESPSRVTDHDNKNKNNQDQQEQSPVTVVKVESIPSGEYNS